MKGPAFEDFTKLYEVAIYWGALNPWDNFFFYGLCCSDGNSTENVSIKESKNEDQGELFRMKPG